MKTDFGLTTWIGQREEPTDIQITGEVSVLDIVFKALSCSGYKVRAYNDGSLRWESDGGRGDVTINLVPLFVPTPAKEDANVE